MLNKTQAYFHTILSQPLRNLEEVVLPLVNVEVVPFFDFYCDSYLI